jgi:hypothetical protein
MPGTTGHDLAGCSKSSTSHPPNPELSEQLFSRVGYVEPLSKARTMLAGFSTSF